MSNIKKTIFLSNKQESSSKGMAIVTLERKNQNIYGTIKVFNLNNKINYILGIKNNEKILKQNIILDNNKYNFILSSGLDLDSDLGCVLLDYDNNNYTPLIWGSDRANNYKAQIINSMRATFDKIKNTDMLKSSENKKKIENNISQIRELTPHSVHSTTQINSNYPSTDDEKCYTPFKQLKKLKNKIQHYSPIHSRYNQLADEKSSYSQISLDEEVVTPYHSEVAVASSYASLFDSSDEDIEKIVSNEINKEESSHPFYNMIAEQLDELFDKYPKEENLEKLIDNSKWIKINNSDNKYYVVGIIYNKNDVKYICYGVPGEYSKEPPIEMRAYSQWLPTDIRNPYNVGYWVMYQDADTGENVMIN